MYADLDDPNFDGPYGNKPPKKVMNKPQNKIQNKKITTTNNNKNLNFKNNNNNYGKNMYNFHNDNFGYNNKNLFQNFDNNYNDEDNDEEYNDNNYNDNNDFEDDIHNDENIIQDPLSLLSSPKYKYEDNDDQNIIPGLDDIKSQIDIQKIESIISSLNDTNHKYKTIKELQNTLKSLTLKNNLTTEESQAFLTYCWLAKNLSYYIGPSPDNTPLGALQKRKTQCSGYSRLYKELLKIFKIKSVLVHGIGRTYNLGQKPRTENHEWNAIKLNGKYYLCEVT